MLKSLSFVLLSISIVIWMIKLQRIRAYMQQRVRKKRPMYTYGNRNVSFNFAFSLRVKRKKKRNGVSVRVREFNGCQKNHYNVCI